MESNITNKLLVIIGMMFVILSQQTNAMAQNTFEKQRAVATRAVELGTQMGLDVETNIKYVTEGNVPTVINGVPVPLELLTDEEQKTVKGIRKFRALMQGGKF